MITEVPTPVPGKNEIPMKVKVTTVSRTDCAVLPGKPWIMRCFTGLKQPVRPITGTDFAGIIVAKVMKSVNLKLARRYMDFLMKD